jgi:hypothetical protein
MTVRDFVPSISHGAPFRGMVCRFLTPDKPERPAEGANRCALRILDEIVAKF